MHCAALPIAAVMLPSALGMLMDHTSLWHWLLLGAAVPVSGFALWRGTKQHSGKLGWVIGLIGMLLMVAGVSHLLSADLEVPLTLLGATLVAAAHVINLRALNAAHSSA